MQILDICPKGKPLGGVAHRVFDPPTLNLHLHNNKNSDERCKQICNISSISKVCLPITLVSIHAEQIVSSFRRMVENLKDTKDEQTVQKRKHNWSNEILFEEMQGGLLGDSPRNCFEGEKKVSVDFACGRRFLQYAPRD